MTLASSNASMKAESIMDLMNNFLETEAAPKKPKGKKKPKKKVNHLKVIDTNKLLSVGENLKVTMSDWFRISTPLFKDKSRFPPLPMPNYTSKKIKLGPGYFRVNDAYTGKKSGIPGKEFFWMRFSDKNLYYTNKPDSLQVLGSISIKSISDVVPKGMYSPEKECFSVKDNENNKWKLCAKDLDTKNNWVCKIKEVLGVEEEECRKILLTDAGATVINQKVTQPIILIPLPSKNCNEGWNYSRKGADWNCDCKEGKEQSPVDLPTKENAISSPVKPLMNYDEVQAVITETTSDGQTKGKEYVKIEYVEGALQIKANFGKVVTLNGGVYKAEKVVFHTPSEHTIKGKRYDMEMQVIHYGQTKNDIAKQVVLSFLIEKKPGVYNKFIDDVDFFNLPNPTAPIKEILKDLYIPKIFYSADSTELPIIKPFSFYTYQGSLTAPPCTERTVHYVAAKPIPLGTTAIQMFKEAIKIPDTVDKEGNVTLNTSEPANYRKQQPLNGRHVFYYSRGKFNGPEPPSPPKPRPIGHYEKLQKKMTEYFYVNTRKPSGLPGSFVVSENEAKGIS